MRATRILCRYPVSADYVYFEHFSTLRLEYLRRLTIAVFGVAAIAFIATGAATAAVVAATIASIGGIMLGLTHLLGETHRASRVNTSVTRVCVDSCWVNMICITNANDDKSINVQRARR